MPDNGGHHPVNDSGGGSWARYVSKCVSNQLNKKVLEVILEKDNKGPFSVSEIECARLLEKLGLSLSPGNEIEGVQLCPNGRGVILITLKDQVDIGKYCRYGVLEVTNIFNAKLKDF